MHSNFEYLIDLVAAQKGAATLKARSGYKNKLNGSAPVLPLDDINESDFDFEKSKSILAKGTDLYIETADGMLINISTR